MTMIKLTTLLLSAAYTNAGYCNWGPNGDAASSTCNLDVQGGDWCNVGQTNCNTCGGRWCTNDDDPWDTTTTIPPPPPPPNGGIATTTRYWDCSGGACGCAYVPSGFGESEPVHCHSNAMFAAPVGNEYGASFYGSAAISQALGGGDWMSEGCGKCWKVIGTSNAGSIAPGVQTTLVLKGTNYCPPQNAPCSNGKAHFDIAAPGFDVLGVSLSNTCDTREAEEDKAGFKACGRWMIDSQDPEVGCDCSAFNDDTLRTGCQNFLSLYWDNPSVSYEEVECPEELSELHCAHPYAFEDVVGIPEACSRNDFGPVTTTTSTVTTSTAQTTTSTPETTGVTTSSTTPETTTKVTTTTTKVTTTPETTQVTTTSTTPETTTTEATTTTSTVITTTSTPETTSSTSTTTEAPPSSDACCSWDYASCGDSEWCNESETNCSGCGGRLWQEPNPNCIPLDGECTNDQNGCCNPAGNVVCKGNRWYRQCQIK